MYLLFLEESGTTPKPEKAKGKYLVKGKILVIGGVIISEDAWHAIRREFGGVKRRFKVWDEVLREAKL